MQPQTSIDAYKSVNGKMLASHYQKILSALKRLKLAIYEEIAVECGFTDKHQVSRRLKELEGLELVYKPGTKKATSTGRQAYQYAIRSPDTKVPILEKFINPETSMADIACSIIAGTKQGRLKQQELFNND